MDEHDLFVCRALTVELTDHKVIICSLLCRQIDGTIFSERLEHTADQASCIRILVLAVDFEVDCLVVVAGKSHGEIRACALPRLGEKEVSCSEFSQAADR